MESPLALLSSGTLLRTMPQLGGLLGGLREPARSRSSSGNAPSISARVVDDGYLPFAEVEDELNLSWAQRQQLSCEALVLCMPVQLQQLSERLALCVGEVGTRPVPHLVCGRYKGGTRAASRHGGQ